MTIQEPDMSQRPQPVSAAALKAGRIYFSLTFADDAELVPMLEPMVFVGRDLMPEDAGQLYFQDVDSYQDGIRFESDPDEEDATFVVGSEEEIDDVYEFEAAVEELVRCASRRSTAGV
jgi:hypothetical protein